MVRFPSGTAIALCTWPVMATHAAAQDAPFRFVLGMESEYERNLDLDDDDREDVTGHELTLRGTYERAFGTRNRAYVEIEAGYKHEREQGKGVEEVTSLEINQAYLSFGLGEDTDLILGRFLMRDAREWLVDENLDGVRLSHDAGRTRFDLSLSRVGLAHRDLLDHRSTGDSTETLIGLVDHEWRDDLWLGGYGVVRDGRSDGDGRPVHLGLRSRGEIAPGWDHWLDLGLARGTDGNRPLHGHAITGGITRTFDDLAYKPRLTLGYARASGDDNARDNRARAFRQTGLQSNEGRFGKGNKLRYYGEAFDPELSNLSILTLGAGLDVTDTVSLDLVYNRFRQVVASDDVLSAIDTDPDGTSRDLGDEIDLVIGYEPDDRWEVQFAVGYFRPGEAYARADDALYARIEVDFRF